MLRFALIALLALPVSAHAETVTVFAAASLKTALDRVVAGYDSDDVMTVSYAGSSALAKQVIEGAPADIFISASTAWMDEVQKAGLVAAGTRKNLLGNTLVLVGTKGSPEAALAELPETLGASYLAMALVDAVPAGIYGKQALTHLGLWDAVAPRVAQANDVRAALALVATGEARYGIVYGSDAVAEPRVTQVATFPADSHDAITYPAAMIEDQASKAAAAFLDHLLSEEAAQAFEAEGFRVLR